jgi:hypothetical protein
MCFRELREGHILKMFEKRTLWGKLGPTRKEVIEGWRQLHNEELHKFRLYQIKDYEIGGTLTRVEGKKNSYRVLGET